MKKNLKLIGLATVLFTVLAMNLKVVLKTEHSGDWSMISLAAIGDDRYYQEYQYPTTKIICNGVGRVKCNDIFLIVATKEVGIVKNSAL